MVGVLAAHDGADWGTPGLLVNVSEDGKLSEARFIIFAVDENSGPENDLADVYGYPMEFHVWSDGIEGGADSFDENPEGLAVPGHIDIDVNTSTSSYINIVPFGQTGPLADPDMFTTFLVTVDLSSFNIQLLLGGEYVMSIFQDNEGNFITGGGHFRINASRATGFEDVFRSNFTQDIRPGYLNSQHGFGFEQLGGSFTLAPLLPGDYDYDGDVDGDDYTKWRETIGSTTDLRADGNDDGTVNAADYVVWRKHLPPPPASAASVPEPNASLLAVLGIFAACVGWHRLSAGCARPLSNACHGRLSVRRQP
jgi:hypothetical protein